MELSCLQSRTGVEPINSGGLGDTSLTREDAAVAWQLASIVLTSPEEDHGRIMDVERNYFNPLMNGGRFEAWINETTKSPRRSDPEKTRWPFYKIVANPEARGS